PGDARLLTARSLPSHSSTRIMGRDTEAEEDRRDTPTHRRTAARRRGLLRRLLRPARAHAARLRPPGRGGELLRKRLRPGRPREFRHGRRRPGPGVLPPRRARPPGGGAGPRGRYPPLRGAPLRARLGGGRRVRHRREPVPARRAPLPGAEGRLLLAAPGTRGRVRPLPAGGGAASGKPAP